MCASGTTLFDDFKAVNSASGGSRLRRGGSAGEERPCPPLQRLSGRGEFKGSLRPCLRLPGGGALPDKPGARPLTCQLLVQITRIQITCTQITCTHAHMQLDARRAHLCKPGLRASSWANFRHVTGMPGAASVSGSLPQAGALPRTDAAPGLPDGVRRDRSKMEASSTGSASG